MGSAFTVLLFLSTLSFLFTTPGVTVPGAGGGFLALSGLPGQALLKGLVLLGAARWTLGAARSRARSARQPTQLHRAGAQKAA